ncbi:MAG: hypothetical protein M3535_07480 [Actinomycetota bacterium]|nr:hypothetical protein [Actinomycetota bacterium]
MRLRTELLVGVGVALVLPACGSGGGEPTSAAPDVLVTDDATVSRTHEASYLLVDRDDPDTVYLSESELQSGDCRFYVSTDQGRSWATEETTVDSPVETEKLESAPPSPELPPATATTWWSIPVSPSI